MNKKKQIALQKAGWSVGSVKDFLNLSPSEAAYVNLKLSLSQFLQKKRKARHLTQTKIAKLIRSSQSRVAKMEKGEQSVSIDLLVRTLFALGVKPKEIAEAIAETRKAG